MMKTGSAMAAILSPVVSGYIIDQTGNWQLHFIVSIVLPGTPAATEAEVLSSIGGMGAAIEIVSSRLAGWPDGSKLTQLADLQNHGALVIGEFIYYRDDVDFINPAAYLQLDGRDIFSGPAANPAGDPRRLLHWLVKHCNAQNIALPAGTVVKAGSYTGSTSRNNRVNSPARSPACHLSPSTFADGGDCCCAVRNPCYNTRLRESEGRTPGEVDERLKSHAWKACIGSNLSGVRIPLSPPRFGTSCKLLNAKGFLAKHLP